MKTYSTNHPIHFFKTALGKRHLLVLSGEKFLVPTGHPVTIVNRGEQHPGRVCLKTVGTNPLFAWADDTEITIA